MSHDFLYAFDPFVSNRRSQPTYVTDRSGAGSAKWPLTAGRFFHGLLGGGAVSDRRKHTAPKLERNADRNNQCRVAGSVKPVSNSKKSSWPSSEPIVRLLKD